MGRIGLDSRLDKCPHVVVALFPTGLSVAQATGQKRPDIGQLSWPVTVPVNGMLRQFPSAGSLFSIEKNLLEGAPVFDPEYSLSRFRSSTT
jgi:hypothetical protein